MTVLADADQAARRRWPQRPPSRCAGRRQPAAASGSGEHKLRAPPRRRILIRDDAGRHAARSSRGGDHRYFTVVGAARTMPTAPRSRRYRRCSPAGGSASSGSHDREQEVAIGSQQAATSWKPRRQARAVNGNVASIRAGRRSRAAAVDDIVLSARHRRRLFSQLGAGSRRQAIIVVLPGTPGAGRRCRRAWSSRQSTWHYYAQSPSPSARGASRASHWPPAGRAAACMAGTAGRRRRASRTPTDGSWPASLPRGVARAPSRGGRRGAFKP